MTIETPPDSASFIFPDDNPAPKRKSSSTRSLVEWIVVFAGAIVVALLIKTFLVQAFYIPSASMTPTLLEGDRVLVNKLSYHFHDVNRGDVVVFEKDPSEPESSPEATKDLIKRVIGLPGENIYFDNGRVFINGKALDEPYLPPGTNSLQGTISCTVDKPCNIPQGDVWVMGDNRTNSQDSRYIGPVPESTIVGRAFVRVWPMSRLGGL